MSYLGSDPFTTAYIFTGQAEKVMGVFWMFAQMNVLVSNPVDSDTFITVCIFTKQIEEVNATSGPPIVGTLRVSD